MAQAMTSKQAKRATHKASALNGWKKPLVPSNIPKDGTMKQITRFKAAKKQTAQDVVKEIKMQKAKMRGDI